MMNLSTIKTSDLTDILNTFNTPHQKLIRQIGAIEVGQISTFQGDNRMGLTNQNGCLRKNPERGHDPFSDEDTGEIAFKIAIEEDTSNKPTNG